MKKAFALLLLAVVSIATAFAQDKPQKGDIIYGRLTDEKGPMSGVNITEINDTYRIMAHAQTDINGNFSFRLVNHDNTIKIAYSGYETIDIPITGSHYEIKMKPQQPIPPIEIHPMMLVDVIEYPTEEMRNYWKYDPMAKNKPQDIYLPYRNNIRYGSIQELCDNLYLEF